MANHSDDLDALLDSALDDFQSLNLANSQQRIEGDGAESIKEPALLPKGVQGLGMGLPDLKGKKKGKQKVSKDAHVAEALDKLREQTREAVKGVESVTSAQLDDFPKDEMIEDWVKQFEELAGTQLAILVETKVPKYSVLIQSWLEDVESIVETMMQQLLSKEILYEPMKEIGERYPNWLEERKTSLSKEEYERYFRQYELIKELNDVYDNDPGNFTKIVELMQKMQECGQPPSDIVRELAPDFDMASLGQITPEMLESQGNCCIM